ncbi:MAG: GNAT family N-acetyltransferase [Clostridiales bacterium]|nr:GNAT family N-acetyltransferase [Clostridiales bacterium]
MKIKANNLVLRTVTYDDIDEVARTWEFKKDGISREEAKKAIDWMKESRDKNHLHHIAHICFAINEENSNKIIGWCGLDGGQGSNKDKSIIVIFYIIDENYRNKGYATLCGKKLLEYGFMKMEVDRIDGGCAKDNIASKRVLEKIGMNHLIVREDGSTNYYLTLEEYHKKVEMS